MIQAAYGWQTGQTNTCATARFAVHVMCTHREHLQH